MPLEGLLDLIRNRFSPSEGQILVNSLQQDPLVWQFAQDDQYLSYLQSEASDFLDFSPGKIALWFVNHSIDEPIDDLMNPTAALSDELHQQAAKTLETVKNTGLPPADLESAGLLALALYEKRDQKGCWDDVVKEVFEGTKRQDSQKIFKTWRTPFSCLYSLYADFKDAAAALLHVENDILRKAFVPVILHAYLANPLELDKLLDILYGHLVNQPLDLQLESLKWLEVFQKIDLRKKLAKHLIETKKNIDFIANVFSEVESFKTANQIVDPLDKHIRYTLPEDVNRLAALHYYAGNKQKASEIYRISSDILKTLNSQTLFQSFTNQTNQTSPTSWMGLVTSIPNSRTAKQFYINALIDQERFDEAGLILKELEDSPEKQILDLKITKALNPENLASQKSFESIDDAVRTESSTTPSFYVHEAKLNNTEALLNQILENTQLDGGVVEDILRNNISNPKIVELVRDIHLKAENYDSALALTSLLERQEPQENKHKRDLAILYSKKDRWEETFDTLQEFIQKSADAEIRDMEMFAEAALKTDRIDIAISISQNIIKKAPRNIKALILLGEGLMYKGDIIKAIQHMEHVVEMIPEEPETWLTLARLWRENGQMDRAFDILSKGVAALPNEPKLLRQFGKAHLDRQTPSTALPLLEKAFELDPGDLSGKLNLADARYQVGQYQEAWHLLEPYSDNYKGTPQVAKLLGLVLLAMDKKTEAEPVLCFAAEHYPEDIEIVLTSAQLIINEYETNFDDLPTKRLEHTAEILRKASDIHPNQTMFSLHAADIERLKGNHQKALEAYQKLSSSHGESKTLEDWRLQYGLGTSAIALGEHEMGLAALQTAASKKPENLLVLHALVEGYQSAQFPTKAEELARTALKLAPQELSNILWFADYKKNNNEPEDAIEALEEAMKMNPDQTKLKLWLSRLYISTGSLEQSKSLLETLITEEDIYPEELHQAAYIGMQMNELELTLAALEKAFQERAGFNPVLLMDLAAVNMLVDQQKRALELLNVEPDKLEKSPQIALLRADFLSNLGQYEAAMNTLHLIDEFAEKGLPQESNTSITKNRSPLLYTFDLTFPGYLFRLTQINQALGNFEQAQSFISRALEINSNDDKLKCAAVGSQIQSLDFTKILADTSEEVNNELSPSALSVDSLDIICSKIEILLMEGEIQTAQEINKTLSQANSNYPRYLAIQSRLASIYGDLEAAESYFDDAVDAYENTLGGLKAKDLQIVFRKLRNLISIADAALALEDYQRAIQIYENAWRIFDNQPLNNYRFIQALIKTAEEQQKANALAIINHAPGGEIFSDNNLRMSELLVDHLKGYLPKDELMCVKARLASAFSGEWPLTLNASICMNTPEKAVAVLLGTKDEKILMEILATYPENPAILQAYAINALKNNRDNGVQSVEKALQFDTSNPVNHALLAMLNQDQPDQAIKSIETALSFWPEEAEWHAFAADLYNKMGKFDLASKHISEAISNRPEDPAYWNKSADIKIRVNQLDRAKMDLERSAALNSKDTNIWLRMAKVNRRLGHLNEATNNIHTAAELNPNDSNIGIQEAKFLQETQQYQHAENKAEEIIQNEPNNMDAYMILAQAQAKQGKFNQALASLSKASNKSTQDSRILLETLNIRKDQEGFEAVLPDLINLAQENPEDPDILTILTDWLIQTNRLKKAEETAQTILKILPDQPQVYLMLGRLQRMNGQLDQAISHLSNAIAIDPNFVDAYIELGKAYQNRRDLENAIQIFKKGSQVNASDPRPYYYAGLALKECKDYKGAEVMLKQAKKYSPNDTNIVRQLGMVTALNLINNLREAA